MTKSGRFWEQPVAANATAWPAWTSGVVVVEKSSSLSSGRGRGRNDFRSVFEQRSASSPENRAMLHYKKLDVYKCAIEFLALASEIVEDLPRGNSRLGNQFDNASLSIALNIAEGVGKITEPDQAKFFAIARGSAMECGAVLDVCLVRKLITATTAAKAEALVTRLVQMLSKLSVK